ncbi:sugar ABC transporter substrate-binding protein [bacterium LRH843]|nr:sugar ABC transporter substrate-binding protein [bacterium LRH843]
MSGKVSRREFLKQASKWSLFGTGILLSNHLLAACVFSPRVKESKGQIVFANKSLGYYFFIIQQEAMHRAAQARGYDFSAMISNMNSDRQIEQMKNITKKKPTAIICEPVASDQELTRVIDTLKQDGIPVGVIDTPLLDGDVSITVAFDNYKGGEMAAEKVIELLKEKYKEPKGIVLNCYGDLKSVAWKLRKDGFENKIKKYKQIKLISKATSGDLTKMYDVTYETLQTNEILDAVHAPSETPARGMYEALKARNKLHPIGNADHVIFVTIDGEPIAHEWIKEGILDASISQDPIAHAEICVEMLDSYVLQRKPLPLKNYSNEKYYWKEAKVKATSSGPSVMIPPFEINKNNVNDKRHWANIAFYDWGIKYL